MVKMAIIITLQCYTDKQRTQHNNKLHNNNNKLHNNNNKLHNNNKLNLDIHKQHNMYTYIYDNCLSVLCYLFFEILIVLFQFWHYTVPYQEVTI